MRTYGSSQTKLDTRKNPPLWRFHRGIMRSAGLAPSLERSKVFA